MTDRNILIPVHGRLLGLTQADELLIESATIVSRDGSPINFPDGVSGVSASLSVDDFEAVGDGVFDDYAAFFAALAACVAAGGGTVRIGAKRYFLGTSLVIPANCRLQGDLTLSGQRPGNNFSVVMYALLLGPGVTINLGSGGSIAGGAELSRLAIFPAAFKPAVGTRGLINMVAAFAGTGVTFSGGDACVKNCMITGFNTGIYSSGWGRPHIEGVYGDNTNGIVLDNVHDSGVGVRDVELTFYATINQVGSVVDYAISNIAANGSGLYRVTIPSHILITGDVIHLYDANINAVSNRWTVTVIDSLNIDLQGSSSGGTSATANTVLNQNWVSVASVANIAPGQTVTGTGIRPGTTVAAVSIWQKLVYLSLAANASNNGVTLTFGDPAFTSGGTVEINTNIRRGGTGISLTSGEEFALINCVVQGFDVGFYAGHAAGWVSMQNCAIDNINALQDPNFVGLWIDDTAFSLHWVGGSTSSCSTTLKLTGTSTSGHTISGVTLDSAGGPYSALMDMASGRLTLNGCTENTGANMFVGDGIIRLLLSGNDFTATTPRYQTATGINKVLANNAFANGASFAGYVIDTPKSSGLILKGVYPLDGSQGGHQLQFFNSGPSISKFLRIDANGRFQLQNNAYTTIWDWSDALFTVTLGPTASDRGFQGGMVSSTGQNVVAGDAQARTGQTLYGTTSSTATVRLTADGAAAGATNIINMPNNAAFLLNVSIVAIDHTTPANSETWGQWTMKLTRGASNATTVLVSASKPSPLTSGTVTGSDISATADTTNGGLNITFTPPSGNTDTWNVVARVDAVEVL